MRYFHTIKFMFSFYASLLPFFGINSSLYGIFASIGTLAAARCPCRTAHTHASRLRPLFCFHSAYFTFCVGFFLSLAVARSLLLLLCCYHFCTAFCQFRTFRPLSRRELGSSPAFPLVLFIFLARQKWKSANAYRRRGDESLAFVAGAAKSDNETARF